MAHAGTKSDPIPQYLMFCKMVDGEKKHFVVGKNTVGGEGGTSGPPFKIVNSADEVNEAENTIFVVMKQA